MLGSVELNLNIHIYCTHSFALEQTVEPPAIAFDDGSLEVDFRTEPPVGDEDLLLGRVDGVGHGVHVAGAVDEPRSLVGAADGCEAAVAVGLDEIAGCCSHRVLDAVEPFLSFAFGPVFEQEFA